MHLAISALNAWSFVFLTAALAGGYFGSSWHVTLGLLASIIAVMAQSAVFALFIGAAKTLKETVAVYRLPHTFISRTSEIYFRLFPWATAGALVTAAAAIFGGLAHRSPAQLWIHGTLALAAYATNVAAAIAEHRQLRRMHDLLAEMAAATPAVAETAGRPTPEAAGREIAPGLQARARGKAILTLSALGLVTLLGYHFLAGGGLPPLVLVLAGLALAVFVGVGLYFLASGRGG